MVGLSQLRSSLGTGRAGTLTPMSAVPPSADGSTHAQSSERLRVVHALRLKGFADTDVVAAAAGLAEADTRSVLDELATTEQVKYREGRMTGWMLTPAGRAHGESLLAAELDEAGIRAAVDAVYRRFLELNQGFLGLCTDWQVRDSDEGQVPNDHSDADYDAAIIARLAETDAAIQPICADLGDLLARFGGYTEGFGNALAKVQAGEQEWFTKPIIESYHTVWFELHEDLLATLGIDRQQEGSH